MILSNRSGDKRQKSSILQLSKSGKVVNVQYHENGKE
jgi:hypothetical protein